MFTPSRDEARRFLAQGWRKFKAGQPLSALEGMVAEIVAMHPEHQALLLHPERHLDRDWSAEAGEANPFLHLSLHLAVAEQLAIDQPPGIVAAFERLCASRGDTHSAVHAVIECLGEVMWEAQRNRCPPDSARYLDCLQRSG
jgi:hypothetical protein